MKTIIFITVITLGLTSCSGTQENDKDMFGIFKKSDPIEKFWSWFAENENRFRDFNDNSLSDKHLTEILNNAKQIADGLAVELEPPKDGVINLTVSADGDINLFPIVQQIVDKAPKIKGWHFFAFRQRIPEEKVKDIVLTVENHKLTPSKVMFYPIITKDSLDIIIYTENVTEENRNQLGYGCLMLLDNILGEYDCVKKVRSFDFHPLPTDPSEVAELKPLTEITKYVDNFHAARR
jgi:hypothetical protein